MKRVDIASAIFFLLLAAFAINQALGLPKFESFGPGGDFAPFWLGVVLVILAMILLVSALRGVGSSSDQPLIPSREGAARIVSILGSLCAYTFLVDYLGYLLSTFLFLCFLVAVLGRTSLRSTLAIAVGGALALTGIFSWLLQVPVPHGFLPL